LGVSAVGEKVGVAVGGGSGVGVSGGVTGVSVDGTGVSVGGTGVGVGAAGVSVAGPGVTVGHGVGGHGCAPTGTSGNDAITSTATVNKMTRLRKRIISLPFASR